jgi:hypothetical protein
MTIWTMLLRRQTVSVLLRSSGYAAVTERVRHTVN